MIKIIFFDDSIFLIKLFKVRTDLKEQMYRSCVYML